MLVSPAMSWQGDVGGWSDTQEGTQGIAPHWLNEAGPEHEVWMAAPTKTHTSIRKHTHTKTKHPEASKTNTDRKSVV